MLSTANIGGRVFSQSGQINSGINYLKSLQNADGSWGGTATSLNDIIPTTAAVLEMMRGLEATTSPNQTNAIQFLTSQTIEEHPFLAARIIALAGTNTNTSADLNTLLARQNPNGGWGTAEGYESDSLDTSQVLLVLGAANVSNTTVLTNALNYLARYQNQDGGWALTPGEDSQVFYTAMALQAINSGQLLYNLSASQARAITYLRSHQNTGGGYGSPASTAFETAASLLAILGSGQPLTSAEANAISFLNSTQLPNGSWADDAYSTALALRALTFPRDTDADGMPDDFETANGLNPNNPADATADNDGDGLQNVAEFRNRTNPNNADTDGDGSNDFDEIANGSDPRDAASRNRPPVISSQPLTSAGEEQAYSYQVQASDPDGDAPLSFSLLQSPDGMSISATGLIGWTPASNQSGGFTVIVKVRDSRGGSALQQYRVNVLAQGIDFTVASVDASAVVTDVHSLVVSGRVQVGIRNLGANLFTGGFDALVFEDHNNNGTYEGAEDNLLGTASFAGDIAGGGTAPLEVRVSGVALFRENAIYALVDSSNQIPENSETNNLGSSGTESRYRPTAGDFQPKVKWEYNAPSNEGVTHAPIVAPLIDTNQDGRVNERDIPVIVFFNSATHATRLVALSGDTGALLAELTEGSGVNFPYIETNPAIGDLDGNGVPEVIAPSFGGSIYCFNLVRDGNGWRWERRWTSPAVTFSSSPVIADLDGDGRAEILYGTSVFSINNDNSAATIRHSTRNPDYRGGNSAVASPQVADLDLDGVPEIVSGPAAFDRNGNFIWYWTSANGVHGVLDRGATMVPLNPPNFAITDGFTAVANLDNDPNPEVIFVCDSNSGGIPGRVGDSLWIFEHDGRLKTSVPITLYQEVFNQESFNLSSPTIADFDGDGDAEIAISAGRLLQPNRATSTDASQNILAVYERDGSLKWRRDLLTVDYGFGHGASPVAAFDFDGDGAAELVYQTSQKVIILNGRDGATLYEIGVGHFGTTGIAASTNPTIADVDNDGLAEIIVPTVPGSDGSPSRHGILVLGDTKGNWRNARPVWNQWLYHITNVEEDGGIPRVAANNGQTLNNSRAQIHADGRERVSAPDLTVSKVEVNSQSCPASLGITARIGNGGSLHVARGQQVNFYNGDPTASGALIGTRQTTRALYPGEFENVTLDGVAPVAGQVFVTVNDEPIETLVQSANLARLPNTWAQASGYSPNCAPISNFLVYRGIDGVNSIDNGWVSSRCNIPTAGPEFYEVRFQFPVNATSVMIQNAGASNTGFLTGTLSFSNGFSTPFSFSANGEGTVTFPEQRNISWVRMTAATTRSGGPSVSEFMIAGSYTEPQFRIIEGTDRNRTGNNKASSGAGFAACNPATNQPPVITSAPRITARPGIAYSYQAQAADPNNDPLVFSLTAAPQGMTINATGLITWTPDAGQTGDAAVALQVSDGRGGTASQSYTVNVASPPGVNRAPQITSTPVVSGTVGQAYQYDVEAADPDNDAIVFALIGAPAGSAIDPFTGLITWAPGASQAGTQILTIEAQDGRGARALQSFAVQVAASTVELPPQPRDQDGDGFDETVDCDDTKANVNPGRTEVPGNGLDDDCNPATPDVIPSGSVSCSIVSDKRGYRANAVAQLTTRMQNLSANLSLMGLDALVRVNDPGGQAVFTTTIPVNALAPGGRFKATVGFNTETRAPGNYQATLELRAGSVTVCSSQASFAILSSPSQAVALSGSIAANPVEIPQGGASTFNYTVSNAGNQDLNPLNLNILVVNLANGQIVRTLTDQTSLNRGQSFTGSKTFNSSGVSAGDYLIVLQGETGGNSQTVASAFLKVNGSFIAGAIVRHAPKVFGRVEGSVQQLIGEDVPLSGVITGNLLVPGTPTVQIIGNPAFGGAVEGTGSAQPSGYKVVLNSTAQLGHLLTRTDPILLPGVAAPPPSTGARDVVLSRPGDSAGDFATVRDLILNGNVGLVAVPPGTYRRLDASGPNGFVFGVAGATAPAVYNLEKLNLNALESRLQIAGPVTLNLANGLTVFGSMGDAGNPQWLVVNIATGGTILEVGSSINGILTAPTGSLLIKGGAVLKGAVLCDSMFIQADGVLRGLGRSAQ